jgi:hypothetical protein
MTTNRCARIGLGFALLLLTAACETSTQLGSACPNGVCRDTSAALAAECLVSNVSATIHIEIAAWELPSPDRRICMPRQLAQNSSGKVDCQLAWQLPAADVATLGDTPRQCSDHPGLEAEVGTGSAGAADCRLPQLTAKEAMAADAFGWYYDASGADVENDLYPCVRLTAAAASISDGVDMRVTCQTAQASGADGGIEPVAASQCAALPDTGNRGVGDPCLPSVIPEGGFDDREAYVEAGSNTCESHACLVYHLQGDPRLECRVSPPPDLYVCPNSESVNDHVYCSCRCDAAGGPGPECDCPSGFACQQVLETGPEALRGGYCVRLEGSSL